jgi:hypothetical protein
MGSDSKSPASWGVGIEKELNAAGKLTFEMAAEYAQKDYGTVAYQINAPVVREGVGGGGCGGGILGCVLISTISGGASSVADGSKSDISLNLVKLPMTLRMRTGKYFYLEGGFVPAIAVAGKWSDYRLSQHNTAFSSTVSERLVNTRALDFGEDKISRFDFQTRMGFGFRIPFSSKTVATMGLQRDFSLLNLNQNSNSANLETNGNQTRFQIRLATRF